MPENDPAHAASVCTLNDAFRRTLTGGQLFLTSGVQALAPGALRRLIGLVRTFEHFDAEDDPYHEHDFGAVELEGERYFFKIDYYDPSMHGGSENPADPTKTTRVLTLMRADEY